MTETLERALAPLLTFGSFFGLGMFEYPRGQPRAYLSCLYALAKWGSLIYFHYYPYLKSVWQDNGTFNIQIINLVLINTLIIISLCRFKELKMCLRELAIVDDTLEALRASKEYHKLRKWMIRIIIGWTAYVFYQFAFSIIFDFFILNFDINFTNFIFLFRFGFLGSYPSNVIILSALISAAILGCISSRFHRINERLRVLYLDLFESSTDYRRQNRYIFVHQQITGAKDHYQYIWIIMHIHLQLCLISRKLNVIFKVQILLQMIWYFVKAITLYLSMYYLLGDHRGTWTFYFTLLELNAYFDSVLISILFLMLNYVCQTVYFKINETVAILQKLSNYNLDEDLRKQILQFILQIKQTKVEFGLGHYCFGYNFICEMYSTALSATIILTTQFNWGFRPLKRALKS